MNYNPSSDSGSVGDFLGEANVTFPQSTLKQQSPSMYYLPLQQSLSQSVNTCFEAAHNDISILREIIKVKKDGYAELHS